VIDLVRRSTAPAALVATAALLVGCGAKGDEASPTTTQIDRTTTSGAAPSTTGATTTTTDDVTSTTAVQSPIGARAEAQQAFLGAVASLNAAIGAWEVANGAVTETPTVVIRWCSTIGPELAGAADALQARNDWDGAEGQVSRFALALRSEAAIHAECAVAAASFDALDPILDRLEPAEDESVAAAAAARTALGLPPA
jgi:hypothetical protein